MAWLVPERVTVKREKGDTNCRPLAYTIAY